jgi:PIN domain nuclease of toxin-antitoxin system
MPSAARVIDSSVVLAFMLRELTAVEAEPWLTGASISAVNLSEVITKLIDRGLSAETIAENIADLNLEVRPFDQAQAERAGLLRSCTRELGLSLGDRACLALAIDVGGSVATADKAWAELDIGIPIELIR